MVVECVGVERMRKKVLVVEDDFLVRLIVCHYLESMGWQVTEVESGRAALELFVDGVDAVDAVLTDLLLPDMNGVDLARRAQTKCPFIFMSGAAVPLKELPGPVLYKPFDEASLRAMLTDVMAGVDALAEPSPS